MNQFTNQVIGGQFQRPRNTNSRPRGQFRRVLSTNAQPRGQFRRVLNTNSRPRGQFRRILNTRRQARRPRPQNTTNPPVGTFTAIQQYVDLVEGSSPFNELQNAEIPSQNTQYPTALFSGFSF
ncbi:hypothetical protein F8M41_016542 [Gigaspora margarita]|uniref:Uncharacterized protein n=1 Tax=Gigaspora margarita TaxID=4874 RepID=A0A8H4EUU5_GIGMA|nr:hypothetical protein F8M41_016542 [Gigaspora margarita]